MGGGDANPRVSDCQWYLIIPGKFSNVLNVVPICIISYHSFGNLDKQIQRGSGSHDKRHSGDGT